MDNNTLQTITASFADELKAAKNGEKTSLPFIVHQLGTTLLLRKEEDFQVLKIGGSILQKSRVSVRNGTVCIKTLIEERLPVLRTKDVFLSLIDTHLDSQISVLALNFAYPMEPVFQSGKLDGRLVSGTKEHGLQGLAGQCVGETIENYIRSKYGRDIRVTVANDTVCLALSGLPRYKSHELVGGIVGTGVNFAFFLDDTHMVNLESANFDKFHQSEEGKIIDSQSLNKGGALFEKEVSGGYLFHHLNIVLAKNKINHPAIDSTHQLNRLARSGVHIVSKRAQALFDHSASLISCQIAGITNFKACDTVFVMEGSLFWSGWQYREMVEKYVRTLTKCTVSFVEIKDCGIIGASKLVV